MQTIAISSHFITDLFRLMKLLWLLLFQHRATHTGKTTMKCFSTQSHTHWLRKQLYYYSNTELHWVAKNAHPILFQHKATHAGKANCSHFAYISVCLLSFCLHVTFCLQMCIISPTYGYDLEGLSRIDNTVKTREFRVQDKLEELQFLVSMDSSIGDVLLTENVEDQ